MNTENDALLGTDERPRGFREVLRRNVRWQLPPVLLIGAIIAWIDRSNLGVAAPFLQDDLGISPSTMGVILGSYAFVLIFMHPFAAWLVDKLGDPRLLFFGSAIAWFVFTSATALARGAVSLFTLRFLLAVGEAPQASCALKATSQWFPRRERALAIGTYEVGSEFGGAIAVPLVTALIAGLGWRGSFVVTGLMGLVFAFFWLSFYRTPRKHAKVTVGELQHIEDGGGHVTDTAAQRAVRWLDLFRYRTVWGLIIVMFCRTSTIFFFITWYPTYLVDERGFSLLELGLYGAIPGLVAIAGDLLGGWFSDYLVRRGTSPTLARKAPIMAGLLAGTVIAPAALVSSPAAALVLLSVASAGVAFCTGALYSLPLEVAPTPGNAVSLSGLMRAGGLVGGAVVPILIGFVYEAAGSFVLPLVLVGGILAVVVVVLLVVVGRAEPLPLKGAVALSRPQ
ncbi:MAG: MFS transporter [Streptosporangiales bacterium]|nr:MFS transporter [Streptosporangiales bacterium]